MFPEVALCTTTKNRLEDLRLVLPRNLKIAESDSNVRFYVLDYSSDDGVVPWAQKELGRYLESGMLKMYRFEGRDFFHAAHAKNIIHRKAEAEIICNMDADNYIETGFIEFMRDRYREDPDVLGCAWKWHPDAPANYADLPKGIGGRIFYSRKWFFDLGGYEEQITGYGVEDRDLISRGIALGMKRVFIPRKYLESIPTGDEKRVRNLPPVEGATSAEDAWTKYLEMNEKIYHRNKDEARHVVNEDGWGLGDVTQISV